MKFHRIMLLGMGLFLAVTGCKHARHVVQTVDVQAPVAGANCAWVSAGTELDIWFGIVWKHKSTPIDQRLYYCCNEPPLSTPAICQRAVWQSTPSVDGKPGGTASTFASSSFGALAKSTAAKVQSAAVSGTGALVAKGDEGNSPSEAEARGASPSSSTSASASNTDEDKGPGPAEVVSSAQALPVATQSPQANPDACRKSTSDENVRFTATLYEAVGLKRFVGQVGWVSSLDLVCGYLAQGVTEDDLHEAARSIADLRPEDAEAFRRQLSKALKSKQAE